MNLLEPGAVTEKNQGSDQNVLQYAREKNLGVLVNRPFNAIIGNRLVRLADVGMPQGLSDEQIADRLEELMDSEHALEQTVLTRLDLSPTVRAQILNQISISETLRQQRRRFGGYERWQEAKSNYFMPRVQRVIEFLKQQGGLSNEVSTWIATHRERLQAACDAVASPYQETAARASARLKEWISSVDPDWARAKTLSQIALRALRSTLGVSTVLIGMRRDEYVEDVLEELGRVAEVRERIAAWHRLGEEKASVFSDR